MDFIDDEHKVRAGLLDNLQEGFREGRPALLSELGEIELELKAVRGNFSTYGFLQGREGRPRIMECR